MRKPFTAPVIAKTGKQRGPAADSASAGEMSASVAVIKSGMAIRGMSEELANVAEPLSLERMPVGGASASPLCTDNASNGITISSRTGKKAKGMRLLAREIEFIKFHVEEGSVEVIVVPGKEQRANPLTKAIRSASVHFREAEWLLGTSPELAAMQGLAEERGRSKRSLRPEVVAVAGFAGYGRASGRVSDTEWAERATDWRETGTREKNEERAVVQRNTLANAAPEGGRSHKIAALLLERRGPLREAKQRNASARWEEKPNHGNTTKFADNLHTPQELAALIFRLDEWMQPPQEFALEDAPSDDEAVEMRHAQEDAEEEQRAESDSDGEEDAAQEEQSEEGVKPKYKRKRAGKKQMDRRWSKKQRGDEYDE